MRQSLKKWAVTAVAMAAAISMCLPAYAATSDKKKIEFVRVKIDGTLPVAGEDIGSVSAEASTDSYSVASAEDCFYRNEDDDIWERGTIPVVRVELTAKDGYYFPSMSKSKITISGMHGEYKAAKVLDGGSALQIDIKLRKVAGELSDIEENYWDGRTAIWTEIDDADKYEVKLYRGTRTVTTVTTSNDRYNFYPYMTVGGEYSFKVRAVSNSDGEKSAWTDVSEDYYISSGNVYTGSEPNGNPGNTTNQGGPGNNGGQNTGVTGWNQNQYGWWYRLADGSTVKNNWIYVDNNYFFMDGNGYMLSGLQNIGGKICYLNPVSDGTRGALKTGVQIINGAIYYFSMANDATIGAMMTGYQFINGNWYYFDTNNGSLWANTTAPDGRWIDGAGVMH